MIQAFLDLRALQKTYDAAERLLEESIGSPVCISGCGKCCQTNVPLCRIIEGINMVSAVGTLGHKSLKRAIQAAEGWLLEHHAGVSLYGGLSPLAKQYSGQILDEFSILQHSQCPFLEANSRCLIYEFRPLICRAYGVFLNGMLICPRPPGRGETLTQRATIDPRQVKPLLKEFHKRCRKKEPAWITSGFAPTLLFRAARPTLFREYVTEGRIASAKLMGVSLDVDFTWQPPLEDLPRRQKPVKIVGAPTIDEDDLETAIRTL